MKSFQRRGAAAILFAFLLINNSLAFLSFFSPKAKFNNGRLSMSSSEEGGTTNRRQWITQAVGAAVVTGVVANKIAIEGPNPYQPQPGSLDGKVVVITGGNTGLGLESAKRLAKGGATIILTSRNAEKGAKAVQVVKDCCAEAGVNNSNIYTIPLDLCDLENVKKFPEQYERSPVGDKKIDVLLNNAGVMAVPELIITKDGYEKTFQSNHLGHFALTAKLMPLLNSGARIVNVSSLAYLISSKGLDMDNLNAEKGYKKWDAYGRSKLENVLFTKELQRRFKAANIDMTAVTLHPGAVRTDLARYLIGEDKTVSTQNLESQKKQSFSLSTLALLPGLYFTKGVDRGATTQIWLASGQGSDVGGRFYQNIKEVKLNDAAMDMEKAKELWAASEKLSGVKFDVF